jgi:retron-type reverse transcriptase
VSAVMTARSISHTEGVDPVRALQRVLYRSAKSDRSRRFHALFDKVARSDVLRTAWRVVAANKGAAGVDGRTIADIEASGVGELLDQLAVELQTGTYRPAPLRRVHIPKPGKWVRPARSASHACGTGWSWPLRRSCSSRSSMRTFIR